MYYSIHKTSRIFCRTLAVFLIFLISLIFFPHFTFAASLQEEVAQDYRAKGYVQQQKGLFNQALICYNKVLAMGDEDAALDNDLGVVYEHLGKPNLAERAYLRSIQLNPDYLPPYTNLGYFYETQGNVAKAIEYFRKRLKRAAPDDPWRERIRNEINRLDPAIHQRRIAKEAKKLEGQIVRKAHDAFYLRIERAERHFRKGQQLRRQKQFDKALEEFHLALGLTPGNPKVLEARKETLYEKRMEKVKDETERALQEIKAGKIQSAKKKFQNILAIIPAQPNPVSE